MHGMTCIVIETKSKIMQVDLQNRAALYHPVENNKTGA